MSNDTRTCTKCNIAKPATLEFFYKGRTNADRLTSWCKDCMKERSRETVYTPTTEKLPNIGESKAVAWLRSLGIPANGGKHVKTVQWLDVLAWGCVRVEVKYSRTNSQGIWSWIMTSVNDKQEKGIMPHVVLFIGEDTKTGEPRYFLFDANHPELFNTDIGKRKVNVTFNYQSPNSQNRDVFNRHENATMLIEHYRLKVSQELQSA